MGSPSPSWIRGSTQYAYFCGLQTCFLETSSDFIGITILELKAVEVVLSENAELVGKGPGFAFALPSSPRIQSALEVV
jgi:hypothetical protein